MVRCIIHLNTKLWHVDIMYIFRLTENCREDNQHTSTSGNLHGLATTDILLYYFTHSPHANYICASLYSLPCNRFVQRVWRYFPASLIDLSSSVSASGMGLKNCNPGARPSGAASRRNMQYSISKSVVLNFCCSRRTIVCVEFPRHSNVRVGNNARALVLRA